MSNITVGNEKNILFYSGENGKTKVEVILQNENVWLNVNAIATLFNVQRPAIVKHINNIYNDEELSRESTCSILERVQVEGTRSVKRQKEYYNLDMIISNWSVENKEKNKLDESVLWLLFVLNKKMI